MPDTKQATTRGIIIRPRHSATLPNTDNYQNRFQIRSESSDALYTVAQHRTGHWWACSCFGWIRHKHCKHLDALNVPGNHTPYEALLENQ